MNQQKKFRTLPGRPLSAVLLSVLVGFMALLTGACKNDGPRTIRYGKDQCVYCKMTISDARFGTQLVTKKGRAYNFDDLQCMIAHVKAGNVSEDEVATFYLPDYANDNALLPADKVFLLKSESLKSPMRGDIAAFRSNKDLEEAQKVHGGEIVQWEDLWK